MLTLHYPLEVDHSLTRRWPEKTFFRMQGRAMSEYVVLGAVKKLGTVKKVMAVKRVENHIDVISYAMYITY